MICIYIYKQATIGKQKGIKDIPHISPSMDDKYDPKWYGFMVGLTTVCTVIDVSPWPTGHPDLSCHQYVT